MLIYFYFHIYRAKFPRVRPTSCSQIRKNPRETYAYEPCILGFLLLNSTEAFFNKHKSKASCEPLPYPRNGYIECTNKGTVWKKIDPVSHWFKRLSQSKVIIRTPIQSLFLANYSVNRKTNNSKWFFNEFL